MRLFRIVPFLAQCLAASLFFGSWSAFAQEAVAPDSSSLNSPEARAAAKVVVDYYHARDRFLLVKAKSLEAPDIALVSRDGTRHQGNPNLLSGFMGYEKAMHGRWHCRVLAFRDGLLEAEIIEENDYYVYLGSGKRIEVERFRVSGGQIHEIIGVSRRFAGRDEDATYHEFIAWLLQLPESERVGVLRDGKLVFDADGARRQLPLLKRFHALVSSPRP